MRLRDLGDYLALRRHLARPWDFVRLRKRPGAEALVQIHLRDGREVSIRRDSMDRHILHRIFARDEYRLGRAGGENLGTVIDVGAHIGLFAIRASLVAGQVLSYEPEPSNFELLCANVRGLERVIPERLAVAGTPGAAPLFFAPDGAGNSLYSAGVTGRSLPVERMTLEEIFARRSLERCDLLKLDCEGAEYEILPSIPAGLWPRIARIALEYHPAPPGLEGWSGERLAALLEGSGHRPVILPSRRNPARGRIFSKRV